MNDSLSTKHLKEMEQFLSSSEQLKIVLSNLEKLNTANKNDLYEIVYSKKVIEDWLSNTIENESIRESLEELLQLINLVLNSLSNSTLKTIADRDAPNTKDLEKLNKLKYDDKKKYKGLADKKQIIKKKKQSLMQMYIGKRFISLVVVFLIMFFVYTGASKDISETLTNTIINENNIEQTDETLQPDENTLESNIEKFTELTNETLHPNDVTLKTSMKNFNEMFYFLISVVSSMLVVTILLRTSIDILYLTMPAIRYMGVFDRFIADETLELIKLDAMELTTDENKVIDYRDKFEVALALLHNTEDWIEKTKHFNLDFNIDNIQREKIDNIINNINKQLKSIKHGINSSDTIKKVESLVDAELLYTRYKDDIEKGIKNGS